MQAFCWNKCILDITIYNACTIIACTVLARLGASWQRKSKRVLYFREGITSPFTGCRDPPFQGITLLQPFVIVATEEINFVITISKGFLLTSLLISNIALFIHCSQLTHTSMLARILTCKDSMCWRYALILLFVLCLGLL